ncbi:MULTISPECIES: hypothetical protein [unclassified Bradyrhizobium]|uniref:hypothetical protein n=1 Tax=unclassified Bradyrhizobium TaxID=2631580 RepID=UPI0033936352
MGSACAGTLTGYETSSFYGVGAPHDTPREIVDLLKREIDAALSTRRSSPASPGSAQFRCTAMQASSAAC